VVVASGVAVAAGAVVEAGVVVASGVVAAAGVVVTYAYMNILYSISHLNKSNIKTKRRLI
jgi:hypothetical protein